MAQQNTETQIQELKDRRTTVLQAIRAARGMFLYDLEAELADIDQELAELAEESEESEVQLKG